jgi:trk system potassium uptake protein TrkH
MHFKSIFNILGAILVFLGISMLFSAAWSVYYGEPDLIPIIKSTIITITVGLILFIFTKSRKIELTIKDGYAVVSSAWLVMAIFSALPAYISGAIPTYTDAFFEAMSGLTTTGASILGHPSTNIIENIPHGILFWRSFTHFIGGMGIIVFSIAILPLLGFGGVQLFRAEVAGPLADKLTPRVKQTAKYLWGIYVGFVIIETLILKLEGMTWFDSLCHSFGTMATGGFSTKSASIGFFQSPLIEWTIILFMFIAATNFSLHFIFLSRRKFGYLKDSEFQFYLGTALTLTIIIAVNISIKLYGFNLDTVRHSAFTIMSLLSSTGYATEDFEMWPSFSRTIIFFLFFIGGSAGSTTGALKIIRTMLVFKYLTVEVRRLIHPKGVFPLTIGKRIIPDNVINNTLGFYLFYIVIFIFTAILFSSLGIDVITATTASASAIGNMGPGLGNIGPMDNWGHFPVLAKWLASFVMLLGRLEIFTIMVLFSRSFWRK